jgi:hypothetical protein
MQNALVRTVLVAAALCVAAWLVVGYRQTRLEQKGADAIAALRAKKLSPELGREGLKALRDAQWLNADQAPLVSEGNLSFFLGQRAEADVIAREVTAREPENVGGWVLMYLVETGAAKNEARERVKALDPWVGDAFF